ncbi:MAG: alpha-2-macroglobulin family protein [Thermoanaerobaculia bacterium]
MRARWRVVGGAALLAAVASLAAPPAQKKTAAAPARTPTPAAAAAGAGGWKEIDRLIDEQKLAEASQKVDALLRVAKARKDEAEWTKALIRAVQLRTGLHGYETAVRFLKDEPWPPGLLARATLDLFYAQALVHYARAYSWEIGQRERVESAGPIDLKAWTRAQILGEAEKAYRDVWKNRAALGRLPVGALSEYVEPNTYPKNVRGTLRDAVSYLYVELLADSSFWSPEESNGVYQLDLAKLLARDGRDADARLANPAAHPLEKITAILGDLETWHPGEGRREAELEARLELLRRLHAAFSEETDRAAIRRDLEQRLPRYRDVPWWAMGMAELAEFRQAENAPDNLIRARQAAAEGRRAYPSWPGGQRCGDLVTSIEAPDYRVAAMSADAPQRRSIEVTHKNLSALFYRAYAVDLERRIATATDYNLLPSGEEVRELVRSGRPVAEWNAPLPPTPDYKMHRTFVTPPMPSPGLYVVVSSARKDFAQKENRVQAAVILLGNLVLVSRPENASVEARVVAGDTGSPVAGVEVWLYAYDWSAGRRHHRVASKTSDAEGLVRFDYAPGRSERSYFLVARKGGEYALDPSYVSLSASVAPSEITASLVYTDRSIYRPLQKILWKVVAYRGRQDLGRLATAPGEAVTLTLRDANNEAIESKTVATNPFGSAAGEFAIPAGRALGGWRIESSLPGAAFVQVEEYKRPTFQVKWEDPKAPLRLNQPAVLAGAARYYFGLPLASGQARWRVLRVPEYPWWWFWGRGGRETGQLVAQGTSPLREDGSFEIRFTPAADERAGAGAKDIVYRYEAHADVTDEGGETRSDERVFRLGFVAVQADVRLETGFLREGVPGSMAVMRTDLDGVPRAGAGSWHLLAIREPEKTLLPAEMPPPPSPEGEPGEKFSTPGDRLRPRWDTAFSVEQTLRGWPDGAAKARGALTHDAKGEARLALPALPAGAWRLRYETRDEFGAARIVTRDFLVAGRRMPVRLPAVLLAERSSVEAGQTARLLAFSGLPGQTVFLETLRGGKVVSRRMLTGAEEDLIEIPVDESDRGGFAARLSLVADHQFVVQTESVFVPWSNKELRISFATFRDKLRPGAKETWRVTVQAPPGTPSEQRTAELLAYMYDQSLDAFVPHNPPRPLALYPNWTSPGLLRASLGERNAERVFADDFGLKLSGLALRGDRLKFFDRYGIGGPGRRMQSVGMMAKESAMVANAAPASVAAEGDVGRIDAADKLAARTREEKAEAAPPASPTLRSDFSETAFWKPQLLTGADGSAAIEFQVPDSVTSWNVWIHGITRDFAAGSLHQEARSVKELMVRPYVPRFLREGDTAELKVVVNNASDRTLSGRLALEILDTETNGNALAQFGLTPEQAKRDFTVAASGGSDLTFAIAAPRRVGSYAIKVTAVSGDLSDGELRPVPVLPGRMQLAQSRFVAVNGGERRTMTFADMAKGDDPSRIDEQLVVTVDAKLFYSVLNALPYLVNYPYECTEQTLNRFVSTGIVSSLYAKYPAVAKMAEEFSKRDTRLETWDAADPNRKMALEETPWLELARGGRDAGSGLTNVLDPRIAKAEREAALGKLRKAQTSIGAFPWWPGGPPSPYMTLYILYGLAKAAEFGVDVPKDMVQRGWQYVAKHYRDDYARRMAEDKCDFEWLTFVNYVASCYPDPSWMGDALKPEERAAILKFSFKHWKEHSPYLKGYLALTLKRMGRAPDAGLVWASVMDSSKTDPDLGTYWAPEDRAWLWYNDTIETQAFALRTLMELAPADSRRHGLVQWLFLNKKLNQWKSTRATAEVIYSLIWYLKKEGALSVREDVTVETGGQRTTFVFEPDRYTGKRNQVVISGEKIDPRANSTIAVEKNGKGLAFASATWHFSTEKLPAEDRGDFFSVSRKYFRREATASGFALKPLAEGTAVEPGDQIEVQISLRTKHAAEYVHLRDPRAAGTEPESVLSRYKWNLGISWYEETRDSGSNFFFEWLPAGEYTFKYRVRANMAGTFRVSPATVQSMYAPEFNAYTAGATIRIR